MLHFTATAAERRRLRGVQRASSAYREAMTAAGSIVGRSEPDASIRFMSFMCSDVHVECMHLRARGVRGAHARVRVRVRACVCECARACASVRLRARVHALVHASVGFMCLCVCARARMGGTSGS